MSQTQVVNRERTYTWQDPEAVRTAAVNGASGLELLQRMADGTLPPPPIMHTMDADEFAVGDGWARIGLTPQEFHYNPIGMVHGGVLATLLDTATGCAVQTTLPAHTSYASVDLVTKFLRPVRVSTGHVLAEGTVLSRGSRTVLAEARLTDGAGRLLAHATSTCMLIDVGDSR